MSYLFSPKNKNYLETDILGANFETSDGKKHFYLSIFVLELFKRALFT